MDVHKHIHTHRELSPALSNRFTTVWVPALEDERELEAILAARMGTINPAATHTTASPSPAGAVSTAHPHAQPHSSHGSAAHAQGSQVPGWEADLHGVPPRLLAFWRFFRDNIAALARCSLSVRDLLAWATFVKTTAPRLGA